MKPIPIHISIPNATYEKILKLAENIGCVTYAGKPKAATTVAKTLRVILNLYSDDTFQQCLKIEGIDTLAFIQKSVRKQMKACIAEIENKASRRKG